MHYDYKDLKVWQKSMKLCKEVYLYLQDFPKEEYSLKDQIKRSSISFPSNLADGATYGSQKKFISHINITFGSISELETQIILSGDLVFGEENIKNQILAEITEISKMMLGLKKSLQKDLQTSN